MLLSGKSLKHDFIRFVSATMASQVVFSLYSMVDGLMVSIGVNEYAMSAVNLAIPFTNALFSIAVLFAVGSSTLIAIFIAQEKRREANALFSQNFDTLLTLGAVITALVLLFLEPFAYLLGADEITLDYVKQYILGIAPFSVCYLVSYNLEVLVKTDGYPRYALFTVIGGCLTNCVLDYIAIFHLDMGVFGAAVAARDLYLVLCPLFQQEVHVPAVQISLRPSPLRAHSAHRPVRRRDRVVHGADDFPLQPNGAQVHRHGRRRDLHGHRLRDDHCH